MEKPDYLDLDGRQLHILLTIHAAGSLSTAAKMLDMNQSTVSYWLDLLRKRLGDPLFVRAGNGVQATARAVSLLPKAQEALRQLQSMSDAATYDPSSDRSSLYLAGSAVERDFLFTRLIEKGAQLAPLMSWEISSTGSTFQLLSRLREGPLDFAVMPDKLEKVDGIMQRQVFTFVDAVYFDAEHPLAPDDLDAYCARSHVRVSLGPDNRFLIDQRLEKLGKKRRIALQVTDFDSALRLIRGTSMITTLPDCLAYGPADGLSKIAPPWSQKNHPAMLYWHARNQTSTRHAFWRDQIAQIAKTRIFHASPQPPYDVP